MNQYVVAVEYVDNTGPQYDFFCNIPGIKKGDTVVAKSRYGLGICRVLSIKKGSHKASAWIISKVDVQGHEEKLLIESKQQTLNKQMRAYVANMPEAQLFRAIAETDSSMTHLLDQWWSLENKKQGRG